MPEHDEDSNVESGGAGRPLWSGTISFGLVSIPVTMVAAVREGRISLHLLDEDGTPLKRRYYCPKDNREVHPEHILRGYEVAPDQYVVLRDEELESLAPEKSRDIDLRRFVKADDVDPLYFERAYYLLPGRESNKAYRLLAETMEKTGKAGIATFVMREKEYLVAIFAEGGILRAETMRFHDEIRTPEEIGLPEPDDVSARESQHVKKQIEKFAADRFDPRDFLDTHKKRLLELISRKESSQTDVVQSEAPGEEEGGGRSLQDLMAALNESLASARAAASKRGEGRKGSSSASGPRKTDPREPPSTRRPGRRSRTRRSSSPGGKKKSSRRRTRP